MLTLLLSFALALASDAPDDDVDLAPLLELARTLEQQGQTRLARRTLIHVADSDDASDSVRDGAEQALRELPGFPDGGSLATAKLLVWHTVAGGAILPLLGSAGRNTPQPGVQLAGALGTAGAAFAGTWAFARATRITPARTTAVLGIEQLAGLHGGLLATLIDRDRWGRFTGTGTALGALIGVAPALLVARERLDDGAWVTAYSGAVWGGGIGGAMVAMGLIKADDARGTWLAITVGADLGAAAGYALGSALDLSRDDLRMANVTALAGVGATWLFAWSTQYDILWTKPAFTAAALTGAAAGAVGGVLIVRGVGHTRASRNVAMVPVVTPSLEGGAQIGLHGRF